MNHWHHIIAIWGVLAVLAVLIVFVLLGFLWHPATVLQ